MPDPLDPAVEVVPVDVNLREWVEQARLDPVLYRRRQITEIVLCAIGLTPNLKEHLILKGGTLMAVAFRSKRVTGDVDFSATTEPEGFEEQLTQELNSALVEAAKRLRYLDLICRIQGIKKRPKPEHFVDAQFPALEVHIASAKRGTQEEVKFEKGQAPQIVTLEISFRDQVYSFQELMLIGPGVTIQSFSLKEVISEKLRALLQQVNRDRYRRQDIYDIAFLLQRFPIADDDKLEIYDTFLSKCQSRGITPSKNSISDPEVVRRARQDWETLKQEIGNLPEFDEQYKIVKTFYESLPW